MTERGHARRKPLADRTNEALEDARRVEETGDLGEEARKIGGEIER
jgi:hypothetical protein